MTRKQRHFAYEGIVLALVAIGLALSVPALISAHDTVALLAGGILIIAYFAWIAFFMIRISGETK